MIMGKILPKIFLRFDEVADYLNSIGYEYDLSDKYYAIKLKEDLKDIVREHDIGIYYYLSDHVLRHHTTYRMVGDLWEDVISTEKSTILFSGYIRLCRNDKNMLLKQGIETIKINNSLDVVNKPITEIDEEYYFFTLKDVDYSVGFYDIYYRRSDLDRIFKANKEETIENKADIEKISNDRLYICVSDFLCYVSYSKGITFKELADLLILNDFSTKVQSKLLDGRGKIEITLDESDCIFESVLFHIKKDGFYSTFDPDNVVFFDSYFEIEQLLETDFISDLDINFQNAYKYSFVIDEDDSITITVSKEPFFRTITTDKEVLIRRDYERFYIHDVISALNSIKKQDILELSESKNELIKEKFEFQEEPILKKSTDIDEGQGDTLLILGAVMDCIKVFTKPNYTQQTLIDAIIDKHPNTKSLSESTLKKKFALSKSHLKQNVTP